MMRSRGPLSCRGSRRPHCGGIGRSGPGAPRSRGPGRDGHGAPHRSASPPPAPRPGERRPHGAAAFAAGRPTAVLDRGNPHGEARVAGLAAGLGVSGITVRRDIAVLDGEGLLQQVRGGAHRLAPRDEPDRTPDGDCPVDGGARLRDIGVVVPSLTYYWPRILRGASSAADGHGARLHIEAASPGAEDCLESLARLTDGGSIDALLLA